MKYILKIGNMYISRISIDSCDAEINVDFTSEIVNAHVFSYESSELYINLLFNIFKCDIIKKDYCE